MLFWSFLTLRLEIGDWKWTRTRTKSLTTRGHVSYGRNHFHTTSKCKNREEYIEEGGRNWRGHAWNMQKTAIYI